MKPILKLYRGYANEQELIVMGHVFKPTSIKDYDFQKKNLKNATSIINMFRIKTQSNADVYLEHNNTKIHTKTLKDGYFKFCVPLDKIDNYGWIEYKVSIVYNHKDIPRKLNDPELSIRNFGGLTFREMFKEKYYPWYLNEYYPWNIR